MAESKGLGLNIKAVAERTGVPLHTLRAWERRYGVPRPNRNTENHYRLYDEQDIADVIWMKRQVEAGVSPAQASAMLREQPQEHTGASARPLASPLANLQAALYEAFVARDDAGAQRIFNEAWSTFAPEQVIRDILQPTLKAIGDAWQRNLLSVEQEHFASNLVRQRLHALLQAQPSPALTAPRLVAACAPEEQHDLGLLTYTLLAKRSGWNVTYLGQRTPLSELGRAGQGARFIVISATTATGLASLAPLWNMELPPAPLLFGGDVFNQVPVLQEHLPGAFLGSDSVQAISTLATTSPRAPEWKPPRRLVTVALQLEAARLRIAGYTVQQYMHHVGRMPVAARNELEHSLSYAALFLTDVLVSALAFDAPQLMELHGTWANEFMPAHEISMASLHSFTNLYMTVSGELVSPEAANLIREMLARMTATIEPDEIRSSREEI